MVAPSDFWSAVSAVRWVVRFLHRDPIQIARRAFDVPMVPPILVQHVVDDGTLATGTVPKPRPGTPVAAVGRAPGVPHNDELPGVGSTIVPPRPEVFSPLAPRGTLPPANRALVPKFDDSPSGPTPAEGVKAHPESAVVGAGETSLVDVAIVPSLANIEPVPSGPTPGLGLAPGQAGFAATSVGAGLSPPAKSSVVPSGTPAPPRAASAAFSPGGAGAAVLSSDGKAVCDMPFWGAFICPKPVPHESRITVAIKKGRITNSRVGNVRRVRRFESRHFCDIAPSTGIAAFLPLSPCVFGVSAVRERTSGAGRSNSDGLTQPNV